MSDEQTWMQRLEEFLDHVEVTADASDPANIVATLRSVVSRWIDYSVARDMSPEERNEQLLTEWVTKVLDLQIGPQGAYRSRVRRWWRWCEGNSTENDRVEVTGHQTDAPNCWLVRAGSEGEAVDHNLVNDVVSVGYGYQGDLGSLAEHATTRDELGDRIDEQFGNLPEGRRRRARDEVWRFVREIQFGDLVVMPMKDAGTDANSIAIGRIDGPYEFDPEQSEQVRCRRSVTWLRTGVERSAIGEDLRTSLNARFTVLELHHHDAARRIHHLARHGFDPGLHGTDYLSQTASAGLASVGEDDGRQVPSLASDGELGTVETIGVDEWFEHLEGYITWRASVGGRHGTGIAPSTQQAIRANVRSWIRHALQAGLNPTVPAETVLEAFLAGKDITGKSRRWRAGHIRRWWRRWPQYQASRDELIGATSTTTDQLAALVAEFRRSGYPSTEDRGHQQIRQEHERTLQSLRDMPYEDRDSLKRVWANTKRNYGSSGNQQVLNKAINDIAPTDWPGIRDCLIELCFGEGEIGRRIDQAVEQVFGLGPLVATRLPAICHRDEFIPIYVLRSSSQFPGKLDMIEVLAELGLLDESGDREASEILELHREEGDTGEVVVRSNNLLMEALRGYFTENGGVDSWGISRFLYWLASEQPGDETDALWIDQADLALLAEDLLCDVGFVRDIVSLLEDKGQVILYGPPGTGKTFFAQELAWELTGYGDSDEHPGYSLVQFHPALGYEDFVEGFRPQVDDNRQMTYELTPGPLVQLAECAQEHPDELHVMVIDEINRANLPRVLGELLYLLEYRDEAVQTQYRPDDAFSLPENLWFIGTMNTADRSIALIDAAMRRRFHFVPFFPDREPTAGLLRRWCEQNEQGQMWIADLLDGVNERLRSDLGGNHMLIGPSHFMKSNLSKDGLRRIWEYNIEPLIEDQFFGRQDVIGSYRFGEVWKRHGPGATASGSETRTPDGAGDDDEPQSAGDEGAESYGDD